VRGGLRGRSNIDRPRVLGRNLLKKAGETPDHLRVSQWRLRCDCQSRCAVRKKDSSVGRTPLETSSDLHYVADLVVQIAAFDGADCDKTVTLVRFPVSFCKAGFAFHPGPDMVIWAVGVVTRDRYADGALFLTLEVASGSVVRDSDTVR
jgi:hypothetical protein